MKVETLSLLFSSQSTPVDRYNGDVKEYRDLGGTKSHSNIGPYWELLAPCGLGVHIKVISVLLIKYK